MHRTCNPGNGFRVVNEAQNNFMKYKYQSGKVCEQPEMTLLKEAAELLLRAYNSNNVDMGFDLDYEDWKEKYKSMATPAKEAQ